MVKKTDKKKLTHSIYKSGDASPGLLFWRSFYNWQRRIRKALDPQDVTQVQYSIMAALSYLGSDGSNVSQQDIANTLAMDKMMVSDVVKTLLKKKYLVRHPHPEDARAYTLALTLVGKNKLSLCVPLVESVDEDFFQATGVHYAHFFQGLKILAKE